MGIYSLYVCAFECMYVCMYVYMCSRHSLYLFYVLYVVIYISMNTYMKSLSTYTLQISFVCMYECIKKIRQNKASQRRGDSDEVGPVSEQGPACAGGPGKGRRRSRGENSEGQHEQVRLAHGCIRYYVCRKKYVDGCMYVCMIFFKYTYDLFVWYVCMYVCMYVYVGDVLSKGVL